MARIIALADTHLFRHDAVPVPDGDILVHAGDLLQHGDLDELARATEWLAALPHSKKIVIAGNHEVCLEKKPVEARAMLADAGAIYLEDEGITLDGIRFHGSPWTPRFRIWAFGKDRGRAAAEMWAKIPSDLDVLVTHGPPYGFGDRVPIKGIPRHVGDVDLLERVRRVRPRVHLFGHIHQDPGQWSAGGTRFYNVTTNEGELPATVIDI